MACEHGRVPGGCATCGRDQCACSPPASMTLGELQRRLEALDAEIEAAPRRNGRDGYTVLIYSRNPERNRRIASWVDGATLDEAVRAALAKAEA